MAKKKEDGFVESSSGLILPATPELMKEQVVKEKGKDFLTKAMMDPVAMDKAIRIAAGEALPDADLVSKTEKLLEVLPTPEPDLQPTIGREEIIFIDELFKPPLPSPGVSVTEPPSFVTTGEKVKSNGGSTSYYEIPDGASELNDLIEHKGMGFALGNIFKACYRLGEKDGTDLLYDINKIIFFGHRLKAFVEKNGRLP